MCPPRELLEAFANGSAEESIVSQFELHLNGCEHCQQVLTQLYATPDSHLVAWRSNFKAPAGTDSETVDNSSRSSVAAHRLWSQHSQPSHCVSTEPTVDTIEPGRMIGRYRVDRFLGRGGFGLVVSAYDERLRRHVAIKLPNARFIETPVQREIALAEARTVAGLDHPNIVPLYDVGSTETHPLFLVSKLINGPSLAEYLEKHSISYNTSARIIADVADALDHAHARGIIHRDVKPRNILIDSHDRALITDFGLAWCNPQAGDCETSQVELDMPPSGGTPAYMAPEQLQRDKTKLTVRADIYALGKVLGELLAAADRGSIAIPSSNSETATLARELHAIHEKAVARLPEERFASAGLLAAALRKSLRRMEKTRAAWRRPALIALAVVLMGAAWLGYEGRRAAQTRQRQNRVDAAVADLLKAEPGQLHTNLASVESLGTEAVDALRLVANGQPSDRSLRAQLALLRLRDDAGREACIQAVTEAIFSADTHWLCSFIDAIKDQAPLFREQMLEALAQHSNVTQGRVLNAAQFLATLFPNEPIWTDTTVTKSLVQALMLEGDADAHFRAECLSSVGKHLSQACSQLKADSPRLITADQSQQFYQVWAVFAGNDVEEVIELLSSCPDMLKEPVLKQLRDDEATRKQLLEILDSANAGHNPIRLAGRKRASALALLSLGHEEQFWIRWTHCADPSFVTNLLYSVGSPPLTKSRILQRLVETNALEVVSELPKGLTASLYSPELSQRRALLQALGVNYSTSQLNSSETSLLVERLRQLAVNDADPAVHGLAMRLLPTLSMEFPPAIKPSAVGEVCLASDTRWHINSLGQTMVHVPLQRGGFAVASCETECAHFEQFLTETGYAWDGTRLATNSPRNSQFPSCPQLELSWYDCAAFCNWLSRKEGLDECFEPNDEGIYAAGMHIKADATSLNGYRMPAESEWIMACRAGAATSFYFGGSVFTPADYMWMLPHSKNHGHPVGSLRPNALGLYDMHGNAAEWTLDGVENGLRLGKVSDDVPRVHRGGSITDTRLIAITSDARSFSPPHHRNKYTGLRIVRTLK